MIDVAILGAGELGGALAHRLARTNAAATIRLVDETGRVAAGKALDIAEAAPIEGFATAVSGSTDAIAAAGADVIVLADRSTGGEWQDDDGLLMLKRVAQQRSGAIIVCAGAAQRDLVERGVGELGITRTQLFGSAPGALAAAAHALIALEMNASPRDVALTMLGVPPGQIVIPWDEASIGGVSATRALSAPARRRIIERLPALWPPGPYALAAAAAQVVESIATRSRRLSICFVAPDRSAGTRARTAALPVRLDAQGIAEIVMPDLNAHDRVLMDNALLL